MRARHLSTLLALGLGLVVGLAGCSSVGAQTLAAFADAREVRIVATDFAFDPIEVRASPGEELNVRLVNQGRIAHDVASRDLGLFVHARAGGAEVAGFVAPDEPGRYELICSIPGHAREGMVMVLVVEE